MKAQKFSNDIFANSGWSEDERVDWPVLRLRHCATVNPPKSEIGHYPDETFVSFVPMDAVGEYGGLRLDQTKTLGEVASGYTYFRNGDVLLAKITPCFENGKGAIAKDLENGIGFGTTELHVLRPSVVDGRYLFYVTISDPFRKIGASYMYGAGGQKRISEDFVKDFRHPIPNLETQVLIARFLDRETARIDALIEKKQRQIELLQEKRAALISHAVTKGLDPNVKMKHSNIEWFGEIPDHWQILRLKYVLVLFRGFDLPSEKFGNGEYPVCASNGIIGYHDKYTVRGPSITVGRSGSVGEVNYVEGDFWAHNTALYVRQFLRILPRYAYYLLKTLNLKSLSMGSVVGSLNRNYIHDLLVAIPSIDEQKLISDRLDSQLSSLDVVIERIQDSIDMLRDYRTALISAGVTGKIDVREEIA
jgi:type I restriction enzyme S subunit